MDLELELTLSELRWDIDRARDGVDPKLRSKRYNPNMDLELNLDGTGAEAIVNPKLKLKGTTQIWIWSQSWPSMS